MKKNLLILVVLACALAFTACSNDDDDNAAGETTGTTNEVTQTPTTTDADVSGDTGATGDVTADAGGAPAFDVNDPMPFLDWHFPAVDLGGITLSMGGTGSPYSDNPQYAARYSAARDRVEERFNVNLTFDYEDIGAHVGWSDVPEFIMASVAAGDPVVNIFAGSAGFWYRTLANNNAVVDMTDYITNNFATNWWRFVGEQRGAVHGVVPRLYSWVFPVYNRELIRASGMQYTPSEMFVQGRWSWEDFYDYMVELRPLLPSDVEMIGMHMLHWTRMLTLSNGADPFVSPVTNVPAFLTQPFLDSMLFTQRLVADGLWRQPGFIEYGMLDGIPPEGQWSFVEAWMDNTTPHMQLFRDGGLVFTVHHPWSIWDSSLEVEFGIVPMPWGPNVSFPASGDWRDLRMANPGMYSSSTDDAENWTLIAGTPDVVTPEVFFAILATWDPEVFGYNRIRDYEREQAGLAPLPVASPGGGHDLFTDLDRELYAWYVSAPTWSPDNAIGLIGLNPPFNRTWQGALATGTDFRVAMESVVGSVILNLMDSGSINEADIPADLRPFVDEALQD